MAALGSSELASAPAWRLAEDGVTLSAPPQGASPVVSESEAATTAARDRGASVREAVLAVVSGNGASPTLAWAVSLTLPDGVPGFFHGTCVAPCLHDPYLAPPAYSGFYVTFVGAQDGSILFDDGQMWPTNPTAFQRFKSLQRAWFTKYHPNLIGLHGG